LRFIAIDWSGALRNEQRKIWLAEAKGSQLLHLEDGKTRAQIADYLIAEAQSTPDLIVGLDFAFSMPAWFLAKHGLSSAPELWSLADQRSEEWLKECPFPFWGRPGRKRPPLTAHFRATEESVPDIRGISPKSVFQIGGAGAVGTGSLRGMPILRRLRDAGFSIWPFDPIGWPLVIEIYPRLLTGPVNKTSQDARTQHLSDHYPDLDDDHRNEAEGGEDAFDAGVSALVMAASARELAALPQIRSTKHQIEGLIWYPGIGPQG
jgi:hypothetical protein